MEKNNHSGDIVRILIYLALFAAGFFLDRSVLIKSNRLFKVLAMSGGVLACAGILSLLLSVLNPKSHRGAPLVTLFSSVIRYVALIVILCWGLSLLGVNVNTIVTSVGILTLVIGFGAESLISDLVTGVFMLLENQYNVGDIVEVNGFRGTVKSIGIRTTEIMDVGKNIKIVNNSDMKNILNRSDNVSIAVSTIDVPYPTDIEALERKIPDLLKEMYENHKDVMLSEPQYLGISELGSSGITLKFIVEVTEDKIFSVPRTMNRDLLLGFRKLGVEVPYPQLDVHKD